MSVPIVHLGLQGCRAGETGGERVRASALAGSWYLKDPAKLRKRLSLYLDRAGEVKVPGRVLGLVSPHAGFRYSGQAAAYGYKALEGKGIERVVVLGVSHGYPLKGASVPDATHYETPLGKVPLDRKACEALLKHPLFDTYGNVHRREHSVEIQLPFLQAVLGDRFKLVPVVFGSLKEDDYPAAAAEIRKLLDDKTVVVASSDFTHFGSRFGYKPFSKEVAKGIENLDRTSLAAIVKRDFQGFYSHRKKTGATICGRVPIGVLLHVLPKDAKGTLLRYYRSGDMSGEWDGSVSYASVVFGEGKKPVEVKGSERDARMSDMLGLKDQKEGLALARSTVESFVRAGKVPSLKVLADKAPDGLRKVRGVFVTLRKHGHLRGCIGSIVGVEPLYRGIVRNTVNAASKDHRFTPVASKELKDISVEVSVLSPLRRVASHEDIIPGWHGVVLKKGPYQSVYLPQVAIETGWGVEQMLTRLSKKAGLAGDAWRSGAEFHVFEAQIIPE